ncbi:MAG: DUF4738 domain-containing protein [Prevotellaceae bacterium]|nr:DUF4738 domain-containing protein [Prevotellaceae bacterium]
MKTPQILTISLLAIFLISCKGNQPQQPEERVIEDINPETGVISLRDYTFSDTITIGGKLYDYTYSLEHVDSMPILINPQGLEYTESRVKISIRQGDTTIFDKIFYKSNFQDIVPENFLKTSTMVGVNYNFTKHDEDRSAFYFIVTVGDPDETSDMAYPLELKVDTDGTYSIKKAEHLETESLNPGLNIDPSTDASV